MRLRSLVCLVLLSFCWSCAAPEKESTPVTWKQDEDEIIFYVYLSNEASRELMEMLNEPVTFEQVSEFLVKNTGGKIPFLEGAMTTAALIARQDKVRTEMDRMISTEGSIIEIIGFKENPVKIMKGALGFPQAPRYLSDFEPGKYPEVVETLLRLMDGNSFVVEVDGRFTKS